jgi:hypothetical protein
MYLPKRSAIAVKFAILLAVGGCGVVDVASAVFTKNADEFAASQRSCDPRAAIPWLRCDVDFRSPSPHLLVASC